MRKKVKGGKKGKKGVDKSGEMRKGGKGLEK